MIRKTLITLVTILVLSSCALKQTQTALNSGNYDQAINVSVNKLRDGKNDKGKQDYVYILEEAFAKAKARDLQNISNWYKEGNPHNAEKIYNTYQHLNGLQELIRPLLPLKLYKQNRNAIFPFEDYSSQIISSKNTLIDYLYSNSKALINTKDKLNCRKAYDDLVYLNGLSPNFKDVNQLTAQAQYLGTDFVIVSTKNETNMVIPKGLENDLLNFNTMGLQDKWTVYHTNRQKNIPYDFNLTVSFRNIVISPEQMFEKEFVKEKQIKDGTKTITDEKGNPVKVDNMKTVKATVYESRQFKTVQITAKVDYTDARNNQLINTFPLTAGFNFEHIYSKYNGDKNACDNSYWNYFNQKWVPFPSNEQMVYDSGEDLKNKLKTILTQNKFRS